MKRHQYQSSGKIKLKPQWDSVTYLPEWKWKWKPLSHVWLFATPWNSPGQNTGVDSLSLLQGIFPTQGLNSGLPHYRRILYWLNHKGSPRILEWVAYPFSRGSSWPRNWTGISCIAGIFFTNWAIREALSWNKTHQVFNLQGCHAPSPACLTNSSLVLFPLLQVPLCISFQSSNICASCCLETFQPRGPGDHKWIWLTHLFPVLSSFSSKTLLDFFELVLVLSSHSTFLLCICHHNFVK